MRDAGLAWRAGWLRVRPRQPLVSFTFDDFPRSALTNGARLLEERGIRATYYVALGLLGTQRNTGSACTEADLAELLQRGHELGDHTYDHWRAREQPLAAMLESVARNRTRLESALPAARFSTFAYPYGNVSRALARALRPLYPVARGTREGFNRGWCRRMQLAASDLYSDRDGCARALALIEANREACGWLIFYTHDVATQPSRFGTRPDDLARIADAALASGAAVLPVAEALDRVGA